MTTRIFGLFARHFTAAGAFALAALGAAAPSAWAQGVVTLSSSGTNSCTYTSITTFPNGNVTVTCSGTASNTATVSFGAITGSLSTSLPSSNATVPVSCSGTCADVAVSLAVTSPPSGVALTATTHTFGAPGITNFFVTGTAPLSAGSAAIALSVTGAGTGVTTTPAVGGSTISAFVPIVDAEAPGTLSFATAAATVVEGASPLTVSVTRNGAGPAAPAVDVAYTCVTIPAGYTPGITPPSGSTLNWLASDATAKSFTINPTTVPATTAGTVTCTLGTPTVGGLGANQTFTLTVNKPSTGGGTCTTSANVNADLSTSTGTRTTLTMGGVNTAALKVSGTRIYAGGITKSLYSAGTSGPLPGASMPSAVQWNVSECPGDFTTVIGPSCGPAYATGTRVSFVTRFATTPTSGSCLIDPSKNYYINLRWVNPSTGTTTCSSSTCGMYVDISY